MVYIGEWAVGVKGYLQDDEIDRLTIKEGTKKIGGLLYNYTKLRSIVIPSSIELICTGAFSGCSGLTTVYNLSSLPIEAGSGSYGGGARYAGNVYTELPTE